MTGLTDETTRAAAVAAGCAAVVTKDHAARDLLAALRAAIAGGTSGRRRWPSSPSSTDRASLSPRERDVLVQLAAGRSTTEIAAALFISRVTVRNHVQRILAKLGAHSRLEAVAIALRNGEIPTPL